MGQLVFQATLGGQVNLVGPNTASTLNINVPAFAGTMASLAAVTNNGVTYVNSSGQPTSGSAFVFDGTSVGIGTTSPRSVAGYTTLALNNTNGGLFDISAAGTRIVTIGADTGALTINAVANMPMTFSTNNTERMRIDTSGNVGIGRTSLTYKLEVAANNNGIALYGSAGTASSVYIAGNGNTPGTNSVDIIQGSDNNGYVYNRSSGGLFFGTNNTLRATIDSSGNVLVNSPAGLGYGTGSGGTVTQATSKSTGVTLNKPTGQITMNNAALAANTPIAFTFNNSLLASTDTLVLSIQSIGSASYVCGVVSVGTGLATLMLWNITAGSRSEAVVLNFAIIKGATS